VSNQIWPATAPVGKDVPELFVWIADSALLISVLTAGNVALEII
jgi:hypothetical protein